MLDIITIYNRLINNKEELEMLNKSNLNILELQDTLLKVSLTAETNNNQELENLYHIIILSYVYSLNTDYNIWIKLDTINKEDKLIPLNDFFIYNKLINVKLFLTASEISNSKNNIIIYPNISPEELKIISEKFFAVIFYNNPDLNSFSNNIITILNDNDTTKVIVKNKTYDLPEVNINVINTIIRRLQELFIQNYIESPKQKLISNWNEFVEDGKVKRGKLDEAIQTIFGKKKNSAIVQKLNNLIKEISN